MIDTARFLPASLIEHIGISRTVAYADIASPDAKVEDTYRANWIAWRYLDTRKNIWSATATCATAWHATPAAAPRREVMSAQPCLSGSTSYHSPPMSPFQPNAEAKFIYKAHGDSSGTGHVAIRAMADEGVPYTMGFYPPCAMDGGGQFPNRWQATMRYAPVLLLVPDADISPRGQRAAAYLRPGIRDGHSCPQVHGRGYWATNPPLPPSPDSVCSPQADEWALTDTFRLTREEATLLNIMVRKPPVDTHKGSRHVGHDISDLVTSCAGPDEGAWFRHYFPRHKILPRNPHMSDA